MADGLFSRPMLLLGASVFLMLCIAGLPEWMHAASISPCPYAWTRNLKNGSNGSDVMKLQQFLNGEPDTIIAISGVGSSDNETTLYGTLTKKAVIKFQEKYAADILTPNGLVKGSGIVGAATRTKLNGLCAGSQETSSSTTDVMPLGISSVSTSSPTSTASSSDELLVTDSGQPPSSLAPANAGVYFLSFTLAAGNKPVQVTGVTIQRAGTGSDGAFSSFGLFDEAGLQIGHVRSLNSSHETTFNQPFTVPANSSHRFDVYANMGADLSNFDGQTPFVDLESISASSPVVGNFPIRGNPQTVNNSLVVGGAQGYVSQYDPSVNRTRYINDTNVRFTGIRMTANSQEDVTLSYIIWTQSGTVSRDDLSNLATVVNGSTTPATVSPYSDKEYVSFFNPAIVIPKGHAIDLFIQGDLKISAANRTVEFDIYDNTDDIGLTGNTYGFGVGLVPGGNTASNGNSVFLTDDGTPSGTSLTPFFEGSVTTVSSGALISIGKN